MQCPECKSTHIRKNSIKKGKQNHICVDCCRQFIEQYESSKGYSDEMKRDCLNFPTQCLIIHISPINFLIWRSLFL